MAFITVCNIFMTLNGLKCILKIGMNKLSYNRVKLSLSFEIGRLVSVLS